MKKYKKADLLGITVNEFINNYCLLYDNGSFKGIAARKDIEKYLSHSGTHKLKLDIINPGQNPSNIQVLSCDALKKMLNTKSTQKPRGKHMELTDQQKLHDLPKYYLLLMIGDNEICGLISKETRNQIDSDSLHQCGFYLEQIDFTKLYTQAYDILKDEKLI